MRRFGFGGFHLVMALLLSAGLVAGNAARAEHDATTAAQAQSERMIHEYLLAHPEVVLEVLELLRTKDQAGKEQRARDALAANRETLLNDPTSPVAGNPNGDVTLVEFFDYRCPYCKRVLPSVMKVIDGDPGLRMVFKEYPILGPDSVLAARAALAAHRQDPTKYLAFHEALMSSRPKLNRTRILQIAREIGFDADRLEADMKSPEIDTIVARNAALARALGISGTPAFVIGDEIVPGAIDADALRQLIAQARQS